MLDYASVINAGRGLVPDLERQMMERRGMQQQQQLQAMKLKQVQAAEAKQAAFQSDYEQVMLNPTPQAIARLSLKYPEMAKDVQSAWEVYDAPRRAAELSQMTAIYARAHSGNFEGAAAMLRQRVEADNAAGQPDPQDHAMLAALESGNPTEQKAALAMLGVGLMSAGGKDALEWLGKQDEPASAFLKEYNDRVRTFGKEAADRWAETNDMRLVPVQPGGTVYAIGGGYNGAAPGAPSSMGGGDPSAGVKPQVSQSQAERMASEFGPDSSAYQFWAKGVQIVPDSQFQVAAPPNLKGPIRVRSVQEAMKLAPGTHYITPDGEEYVR
jgi:hypothetical protein